MDSIVPLSKIPMLKSSPPNISEYGYVWALILYNWCLYKKWRLGGHVYTQGGMYTHRENPCEDKMRRQPPARQEERPLPC